MRAIGLTSGIGSMLIGARAAGFTVLGNIEWRPYYHWQDDQGRNTFTENFPGAFLVHKIDELDEKQIRALRGKIDLAMGHPECGSYSNLRPNKTAKLKDPGDIPLFCELVNRLKPRFFVQDNLPKSLIGWTIQQWKEALPDYDLFPEWISNYHYGNSQFFRRRFFMIGALKKEKFVFVPGEFEHITHLRHMLKGLPPKRDIKKINHVHVKDKDRLHGFSPHNFAETRDKEVVTLGDFKEVIRDYPSKRNFQYYNKQGVQHFKPGYSKICLDNTCPVMTGGGSALDNHYREDTLNPLTMRERARIQGCPDDFIFYPLDYLRDFKTYSAVYKQIGKFMPVQFCTYVAELIAAHIAGKPVVETREKLFNQRVINPNPYIDEAKKWYCETHGYKPKARQKLICQTCWLPCKR